MLGVPVEFLTDEQVARFGCFGEAPSRAELERFFFLDDADRVLIGRHRGEHNRLGFALQLATVRYEETGDDGKRRYTVAQIAAEFGVTRPTIYRHLSNTDC